MLLDVHSLLEDVGDGDDTGEVDDKMEDEEEGAIGRNPADSKEANMEMLNVRVTFDKVPQLLQSPTYSRSLLLD